MRRARVFAPASVANVAVGFDLLGFSVDVVGDIVTLEKTNKKGEIVIDKITRDGVATNIVLDPWKNTATAGLFRMSRDLNFDFGFQVSIEKGIALGSGMGGSAASAVAGVAAANELLDEPLSKDRLLSYALLGEAQASGSFHADNIAPSFFGGLTLSRVREQKDLPLVEVLQIPAPESLFCVLVHPEISISTKSARGILQPTVPVKTCIEQSANLAGFIAGCFQSDLDLISRCLKDVWIEPQRAHLIPGFADVKAAALESGALGCSISGAGPSIFALARSLVSANQIQKAMVSQFSQLKTQSWLVPLTGKGAQVLELLP